MLSDAFAVRLVKLRALEEGTVCDREVLDRIALKRQELIADYDRELTQTFGRRPLCPFCDPALLGVPGLLPRMRQCVRHSLRQIEILGTLVISSDGRKRSSSPMGTMPEETVISGALRC